MKGLVIKNPWAGFIYYGFKTIETRTWKTDYRGDLLICCSMQFDIKAFGPDIKSEDRPMCYYKGFAICVAELWSVGVMHSSDVAAACCKIYPGAYAWRLRNIRRIEAVLLKGKLRLFDIPADIEIKYL